MSDDPAGDLRKAVAKAIVDAKADGRWDKMESIYIFHPPTKDGRVAVNIKNPGEPLTNKDFVPIPPGLSEKVEP
jgi:hypothetical protein